MDGRTKWIGQKNKKIFERFKISSNKLEKNYRFFTKRTIFGMKYLKNDSVLQNARFFSNKFFFKTRFFTE